MVPVSTSVTRERTMCPGSLADALRLTDESLLHMVQVPFKLFAFVLGPRMIVSMHKSFMSGFSIPCSPMVLVEPHWFSRAAKKSYFIFFL